MPEPAEPAKNVASQIAHAASHFFDQARSKICPNFIQNNTYAANTDSVDAGTAPATHPSSPTSVPLQAGSGSEQQHWPSLVNPPGLCFRHRLFLIHDRREVISHKLDVRNIEYA